METRRFGRTGHMSTVAIFGAVALGQITQDQADVTIQQVIDAGVNHIDIAPSYGEAEARLGPWMPQIRDQFFLGCKTTERTRDGAEAEMHRSLERLQVDHFDLYQFHAITSMDELDQIFAKGGALEAFLKARDEGLTRYIGITGHGFEAPEVFQEALRRFDFDSILFPVNFVQYAIPSYRQSSQTLIQMANAKDVGIMAIKYSTRAPWGDKPQTYHMWYEPFDDREMIQKGVNFTLSQNITGVCTAGDYRVLPLSLEACQNFEPMGQEEQIALLQEARQYEPLFPEPAH
jgi:aryl-alcohol dehydrogenase-like predicted oxidoreductase